MNIKTLSIISLLIIMTSCATPSKQHAWQTYDYQNIDFNASGRLSVKVKNKGSHGNFDWNNQHSQHFNLIEINTPLGNTIGQLCKDAQGVIAKNNKGDTFVGKNATELSEQLLGFPVPIDHLDLWANGYIPTHIPNKVSGNILHQDQWTIERTTGLENIPKSITLKRDELSITIIFDNFLKSNNTQRNSNTQQVFTCPSRI